MPWVATSMTIVKRMNTAASSKDNNHHSSMPAAWFASGAACHGRRIRNLGSWTSWPVILAKLFECWSEYRIDRSATSGAKIIKKNSTQNKSQTQHAREVTS